MTFPSLPAQYFLIGTFAIIIFLELSHFISSIALIRSFNKKYPNNAATPKLINTAIISTWMFRRGLVFLIFLISIIVLSGFILNSKLMKPYITWNAFSETIILCLSLSFLAFKMEPFFQRSTLGSSTEISENPPVDVWGNYRLRILVFLLICGFASTNSIVTSDGNVLIITANIAGVLGYLLVTFKINEQVECMEISKGRRQRLARYLTDAFFYTRLIRWLASKRTILFLFVGVLLFVSAGLTLTLAQKIPDNLTVLSSGYLHYKTLAFGAAFALALASIGPIAFLAGILTIPSLRFKLSFMHFRLVIPLILAFLLCLMVRMIPEHRIVYAVFAWVFIAAIISAAKSKTSFITDWMAMVAAFTCIPVLFGLVPGQERFTYFGLYVAGIMIAFALFSKWINDLFHIESNQKSL